MLSPADHHTLAPKDTAKNLRFRIDLLLRADADPALQRGLVELCRQDFLFWINAFVFQSDPKRKRSEGPVVGPFCTWPFQDDALRTMLDCVDEGEDLLIEKSRQMGASWMLVLLFAWLWLFHDWQVCHFISRNAELVDSDNSNSLFWKLRFVLNLLPGWMRPNPKKMKDVENLLVNHDRHSQVIGEASTGKANVGGNVRVMGIDEFSQIREAREVLHRTSNAAGCRIFNGTHKGVGTAFHDLTRSPDIRKLKLHWTLHPYYSKGLYRSGVGAQGYEVIDTAYQFPPDYQFSTDGTPSGGPCPGLRSPWYDKEVRRKGSARAAAEDMDMDPEGSASQFFDALTIARLRRYDARKPVWEGDVLCDRDNPRAGKLVRRAGGPLALWFLPGPDGAIPAGKYANGWDISFGSGATPSCGCVFHAGTGAQVAEFARADLPPHELAPVVVALCWLFKDADRRPAFLGWDKTGPGVAFGRKVMDLGFRHVFYHHDDRKFPPVRSKEPGMDLSSHNAKILLLSEFAAALQDGSCQMRSDASLAECLAFEHGTRGVEHGRARTADDKAAARENHADRAIAAAIGWRMAQETGLAPARAGDDSTQVAVPSPATFAGRVALSQRRGPVTFID